jgi:hypothetical protein
MSMLIDSYRYGTGPTLNAFSNAVLAISPMFYLRLNQTTGTTATNSGSAGNGTILSTTTWNHGPLVANESNANSILCDAANEAMSISAVTIAASSIADADWKGVLGFCYGGTGGGNSGSVRIFGRQASANFYVRGDTSANIRIRTGAAAEADTGVASSVLKDGNPHFVMVAKVSDGVTHDNVRLYIDGAQIWSSNQTITVNSNEYQLANNYNNAQYTYGRYGEFFWSKGNYSQTQVDAILNAWDP